MFWDLYCVCRALLRWGVYSLGLEFPLTHLIIGLNTIALIF